MFVNVRSSRYGRGIQLVGNSLQDVIRHPSNAPDYARRVANALGEAHFAHSSPYPFLAKSVLQVIYSASVIMPPLCFSRGGNQDLNGLYFLVSLAKYLDAHELFEIGTYNGLTAWTLAANLPQSIINTLDIPAEQQTRLSLDPGAGDVVNRRVWETLAYESLPHQGTVVQHWGDSAVFDFSRWRNACDIIYVDGSHSEAYVASDTANALKMLSPRGVIVWDDYRWRIQGVSKVLHERRDLALHRVPGTRLVCHLSAEVQQMIERSQSGQ